MPPSPPSENQERIDIFIGLVVTAVFGFFILNTVFDQYVEEDSPTLKEALATSMFTSNTSEGTLFSIRSSSEDSSNDANTVVRKQLNSAPYIAPLSIETLRRTKSLEAHTVPANDAPNSQNPSADMDSSSYIITENKLATTDHSSEKDIPIDSSITPKTEQTTALKSDPEIEVDNKLILSLNQDECGIIVGSYSSLSNQSKMIQKLKAGGYTAFGYKEKGLYITALRLPCNPRDLRSTIKVIRQDYASGAFIITK